MVRKDTSEEGYLNKDLKDENKALRWRGWGGGAFQAKGTASGIGLGCSRNRKISEAKADGIKEKQ